MVVPKRVDFISLADYLAREEKADCKSEYFAGQLYMMAGGSPNHNRISTDVVTQLSIQTRGKGCETFNSDQRLKLPSGLRTYPDAMVICGKIEYDEDDRHAITNPVLLVEVLSPSTANYDRGEKFEFYRELASLDEYLTIHQNKFHVEQWYKRDDGQWVLNELTKQSDTITLRSVDIVLSVTQIYERVEWDEEPRRLSRNTKGDVDTAGEQK